MLTAHSSLRSFFHTSLNEALNNQHVAAKDHTILYIVNLLTAFSRAENLFEETEHGLRLRPLADYYSEALNAHSVQERFRTLQRLGDIALFVAGLFADSLKRRSVDIDYYIAMGGNAYQYLSDFRSEQKYVQAHKEIFHELGQNFIGFVDVLNEVGDQVCASSNADLLRQYDIWLKTGSKRAAKLLQKFGINLHALPEQMKKH